MRRSGSCEGSQNMFQGDIWLFIPKLSMLPLHIWSTAFAISFLDIHICSLLALRYIATQKNDHLPLYGCISLYIFWVRFERVSSIT